ncbi:MAG: TetR/AcrR family transcriptional regulator [Treponema sp.]|nr:TetR/AcrR family transcriptional regulator [Treponema sp.]
MADTKERIISAAFSFYSKPIFTDISLSKIAEKVGISKAAIFKHFKNKNELEIAMHNKMINELSLVLEDMQRYYNDMKNSEALPLIISFLGENQEYLNYLLVSMPEITEDNLVKELRQHGIVLLNSIYNDDGTIRSLSQYFKSVFVSTTMLIFLTYRSQLLEEGKKCELQNFSHKIASFIEKGFQEKTAKMQLLRFMEIDEICKKATKPFESIDKTLVAISTVISKYGIRNVTVERIANELGMAKSSLYTGFANKAEMIHSLITNEIENLYKIIMENIVNVKTPGEKLYLIIETEFAYFSEREEIIDVCKWIQMSNNKEFSEIEKKKEESEALNNERIRNFFENQKFISCMPDLGIPGDMQSIILGWLFILPIFLLIHGRTNGFSKEIMQTAIKDIYYMIEFGIGGYQ